MKLKITSKDQIPGFTNEKQHQLYSLVINKLPPESNILEIGCGWGRSTWAWLDVIPEDTNFHVLDNFSMGSNFIEPATRNRFSWNRFTVRHQTIMENKRKYLKKYFSGTQKDIFTGVISQHPRANLLKNIYEEDFEIWKLSNKLKFDLVYLDGDHSYTEVSSQLDYFSNCPYICGDDYLWPSVSTAVNEFVQKNNYKLKTAREFFIIYT